MTPIGAVLEAGRAARSQPLASGAAALIVAVVCTVILATTGQRVQDEREVLATIDEAGTRLILIADTSGTAGIDAGAVDRLAALSSTEWVFGLGPSRDGGNPALHGMGQNVSVRTVYGDLPFQVVTTWDRADGTAIVGTDAMRRLALRSPAGAVQIGDARQTSIVTDFRAEAPLDGLASGVLRSRDGDEPPDDLRTIYLMAARPDDVARLAVTARHLLGAADDTQVGIDTSDALIAARAAVRSDLGRQARRAALLVLAVGLVLSGVNVLGMVILRQRDFGRRRVLGASRGDVIAIVALQVGGLAATGSIVGSVIGSGLVARWTGSLPAPSFVLAVAVLTVIAAVVAALPPAALAAYRDPVRALRVP